MKKTAVAAGIGLVLATTGASGQMRSAYEGVDPALAPAIAHGEVPVVVRTMHRSVGARVVREVPSGASVDMLGPAGGGDDGAPAAAALSGDRALVVAARSRAGKSRLWAQEITPTERLRARWLLDPSENASHPAVASREGSAWVVWIRTDAQGRSSLAAARWRGSRLTRPEVLPATPGEPGRPAITLDAAGAPAVVWAATDEADTEIWLSRRTSEGWALPRKLTDNEVPDEHPSIGVDARGLLVVAWASFTPSGYIPWALSETRNGVGRPQQLDDAAAGSPRVVGGSNGMVAWPSIHAAHYELRSAQRANRRWQRARREGELPTPRFAIATRDTDTVVAASDPAGSTWRARADGNRGLNLGLPPLRSRAAVGDLPELPGSGRAFGDSITEGVVRYDGVVSETPGYPPVLAEYIVSFLNRETVTVENRGERGERTTEGLARLSALNISQPVDITLIMEGANDVVAQIDTTTVVTNLTAMIRGTQASGGIAVISTVTPRRDGSFVGGNNPGILRYNEGIVPMAANEGALLVDQWQAFYRRGALYSDQLHPNKPGYTHMAATWFRGLQPLLAAILNGEDMTQDAQAAARARARARAQRKLPDDPR